MADSTSKKTPSKKSTASKEKSSSSSSSSSSSNSTSLSVASASINPMPTVNVGENLNVEYQDDYRNLLTSYDPTKNKSAPEMTKYELALIIGKRATQLAHGAVPLINVPARMTKVEEIAEEELRQKKTPFIIQRNLGNEKYEYWKVKDMKIP